MSATRLRPCAPLLLCALAQAPVVASAQTVSLVSSGRRPGVVRARAAINSPTLLLDRYAGTPVEVTVDRSGPGVYEHGGRLLLAPREILGASRFTRALGGLVPRTDEQREIVALTTDYTVIFQTQPRGPRDLVTEMWSQNESAGSIPELDRRRAWWTPVDSPAGPLVIVELGETPSAAPLPSEPEAWERRDVLVSAVRDGAGEDHLVLVKRPLGEPARMLAAVRAEAERAGPAALLLDPGMAWPERLPEPAATEVARRRAEAGFAAVLPGRSDLADGPAALAVRRDDLGIPFVAANLRATGGGRVVAPSVVREVGGLVVGVVGVVSPALLRDLPRTASEGLEVVAPLPAAQEAVDALAARPRPPDAVVVLANLDPAGTARLQAGVTGAEVVIGDLSRPGLVAPDTLLLFPGRTPLEERAFYRNPPLVVRASPAEVTRVDLSFAPAEAAGGPARLRALRVQSRAVTDTVAPDAVIQRATAALRLAAAGSDAEPLLPDLHAVAATRPALAKTLRALPDLYPTLPEDKRNAYPLRFTDALFGRLAVNVVREALGAEVAVLRPVVRGGDAPGEVTAGEVDRWLEGEPDRVAVAVLTGVQLGALRGALAPTRTVWSGLVDDPQGGTLVSGRALVPSERYVVAIGDSLLAEPALALPLEGVRPSLRFRPEAPGRWAADSGGEPLALAELLPGALRAARFVADPDALVEALSERGAQPEPGFRLRLEELELRGGDLNQGAPPVDGFPDARLTAAKAAALGGSGQIAAELDGHAVTWRTAYRFAYDEQFADQADGTREIDPCTAALKDDWAASTEVRHRRWALPVGFRALPYLSLTYDSQFCPGGQRQAFLGVGAAGAPGPVWQEARAGLAIRYDLTAEDGLQPGVQAGSRWALAVGPVAVGITPAVDVFPFSGREALALDARLVSTADLPLGGGLSFRVRSDLLLYGVGDGGPEGLRHSLTFGLKYDRTIKPTLGLY